MYSSYINEASRALGIAIESPTVLARAYQVMQKLNQFWQPRMSHLSAELDIVEEEVTVSTVYDFLKAAFEMKGQDEAGWADFESTEWRNAFDSLFVG